MKLKNFQNFLGEHPPDPPLLASAFGTASGLKLGGAWVRGYSQIKPSVPTLCPGIGCVLATTLTLLCIWRTHDIKESGGGLESHPRLTTGTLYHREILLSLSPQAFQILLSSCYNYTENGSAQAKRHHEGRGVNPPLSLKKTSTNRGGTAGFELTLEYSN